MSEWKAIWVGKQSIIKSFPSSPLNKPLQELAILTLFSWLPLISQQSTVILLLSFY